MMLKEDLDNCGRPLEAENGRDQSTLSSMGTGGKMEDMGRQACGLVN